MLCFKQVRRGVLKHKDRAQSGFWQGVACFKQVRRGVLKYKDRAQRGFW